MNFASRPYIRVFLLLILGFFIGDSVVSYWHYSVVICFIIGAIYLWMSFSKSRWKHPNLINYIFVLGILFFGVTYISMYKKINEGKVSTYDEKMHSYSAIIKQKLKSTTFHRYIVALNQDGKPRVNVLLLLRNEENLDLNLGDALVVNGKLLSLPSARNPYAFDYGKYLERQGVHFQMYAGAKDIQVLSSGHLYFFEKWALKASDFVKTILDKYFVDDDTKSLAKAILLGDKTNIDDEIKQNFAISGAAHVLAVSGLHITIFIAFFVWLFDKIDNRSPVWNATKVALLLMLIFLYIIITGASPSVVRAGFMTGIYLIGTILFKRADTFNILGFVGICMLLYQPYYIYQPSFQFSFAALASIVFFHPYVSKLYTPKTKYDGHIWTLISVTVAAQIFVLPLAILYFNKFPTYFILSGLVAVPITSFVIYGGVLMVLVELVFPSLNVYLGILEEFLFKLLISFTDFLRTLPLSSIEGLHISIIQFCILVFILFLIVWLVGHFQKSVLYFLVFTVVALVCEISLEKIWYKGQALLTIYSIPNGVNADFFIGTKCLNYNQSSSSNDLLEAIQKPNRMHHYIIDSIENVYNTHFFKVNDLTFLHVDEKMNLDNIKNKNPIDVVVLDSKNYKYADNIKLPSNVKNVVIVGSLNKKIEQFWRESALDHSFNLHFINKQGAFVINF